MGKATVRERGFTLIAALLLLLLLSGVAIGLMYMANGETRIGGNEMEDNLAYYGAESGMELLTANLAALYQTSMSPTPAQITALTGFPPTTLPSMNYTENITWQADAQGNPVTGWNTISSGSNQGLVAEIIPLTLQVNATRASSSAASVNITRNVEVALIPVFQFGIFSDSDIDYFAGPNFDFGGRIHSNGNIFLASGSNLYLEDKVAAFGQVIRDQLENGWPTSSNYTGNVYIASASGGCNADTPGPNCLSYTVPNGSWSGGIPPVGTLNTTTWINTSTNTFHGYVTNSVTGATKLTLPFVAPGVSASQIIRKPVLGESASSNVGSSRLYNKAAIRIMLANTQADLHPERVFVDADDVNLSAGAGVVFGVTGANNTSAGIADTNVDPNWVKPLNCTDCTVVGARTTYPLINGWMRVEYQDAAGVWHGATNEWLQLGFARDSATDQANAVNPNAILMFEQVRTPGGGTSAASMASPSNWYPINFFDPREGLPRDEAGVNPGGGLCYPNGIMSAVEIDIGNLRKYLKGAFAGTNGNKVNYTSQNGYVLYFSDRRGELQDPNVLPLAPTSGEAGLEDVVNSASANGTPDGVLEAGANGSPEDVDQNGLLDKWGGANIGYGVNVNTNTGPPNPFVGTVNCSTIGRANRVSGARRVLKLVNGGLGNLPTRLDNNLGGFTVASENPIYVQGNYNANAAGFIDPHAAAAVIADAVTLLSNNWSDANSLANPNNLGGRNGTDTWYRMAVAGGKSLYFPKPGWAGGQDFGTDGGMHNFLRYDESWGGTLHYEGSLVSLYYSQYATGLFKCCTYVYSPPTRDYNFDSLFLNPANLPPGTPMFQDVVNLSYRQNYTPQ